MSEPGEGPPVLDPHNVAQLLKDKQLRQLSPSTLNDSDICLRRLTYKWDPTIPRTTGEKRIVGTCYHAGLEAYYRARQKEFSAYLVPAVALENARAQFESEMATFTEWDTTPEDAWALVEQMVRAYFDGKHQWDHSWSVVGIEQEITLRLNDGWGFKMYLDLVLEGPDHAVAIVDHKTAGRKWQRDKEHQRKNVQAVIYAWAWWTVTGRQPSGVYFDVMTYKGEFERRLTVPTPAAMAAALQKAEQLSSILDIVPLDQLPTNTSSVLCSAKFCDYWSVCPMGAALDA